MSTTLLPAVVPGKWRGHVLHVGKECMDQLEIFEYPVQIFLTDPVFAEAEASGFTAVCHC